MTEEQKVKALYGLLQSKAWHSSSGLTGDSYSSHKFFKKDLLEFCKEAVDLLCSS